MNQYVSNYLKKSKNKLAKESYTFSVGYDYWFQILLERASRLFVWKNTEDVPQKEIEFALMLNGSCGVTDKYKDTLYVFNGHFSGSPTVYFDEFTDYSVYSPVYSANLKVNDEIIVIDNNACRNSIYMLIHRYAIMLSHVEVSFVNELINGRDGGAIPIASTQAQYSALENYRNALCNGKLIPILDPAFSGVEFAPVDRKINFNIKDLMETRDNLLSSFYQDLGVKTSKPKKGNMIVEEVSANDSMLMLNLNDMLYNRQLGCEKVNKRFGTNWSVEISPELNYLDTEKSDKGVDNNDL